MINGNVTAEIQTFSVQKNSIGEKIKLWETVQKLTGWLDFLGGDSKYSTYSAKIQESTHVFVGDFIKLSDKISAETSKALINGETYDILLIDNPMELNKQLEIYLKYTGGQ